MGRKAGIQISLSKHKLLQRFMKVAKDAREYRAALGILLRAEKEICWRCRKTVGSDY